MTDFVAILHRTIGGLADNSPEMREKVFEKARATIKAKLAALDPQPPQSVIDRQLQNLEDAISEVRAEYEPEVDEIDAMFAEETFALEEEIEAVEAQAEPEAVGYGLPRAGELDYAEEVDDRDSDDAYDTADEREPPLDDDLEPVAPVAAARRGRPDPVLSGAGDEDDDFVERPRRAPSLTTSNSAPRRRMGGLVIAAVALVLIAGVAVAAWMNQDRLMALFGNEPAAVTAEGGAGGNGATEIVLAGEGEEEVAAAAPAAPEEEQKLTQRLLPDGNEVDEGPAGGRPSVGEGSSVASASGTAAEGEEALSAGPVAAAEEPAAAEPQLAVGQRAIFYEERTSSAEGSAQTGNTVWTLIQESPGGNAPPEPAIRGEVSIPGSSVQLRLTIRRNADPTLPAGHIIEMIFLTPENFAGGAIDNVLRVALKDTEEATGSALQGIPAKIADGFFLIALSDSPAEMQSNLTMLRTQSWIDIPVMYRSGRRALMTMEKGVPGEQIFQQAIDAWDAATSG